jgi:predicted ATPase
MKAYEATHYLLAAELIWERIEDRSRYPYALPAISGLGKIDFHPKVTFIVGENGSGKSTLVEALAVAWGFNAEGGSKNFRFNTHPSNSSLHNLLRLIKSTRRARDGFFLRAESYFNVATNIQALDGADGEDDVISSARPPRIIDSYGGKSLHEQSHGESFLALLEKRLRGKGLYIFDEPEAALSPTRQLSMLVRMHELVAAQSQFIIATHSPILMAYPDAWIYQLGSTGLERVSYEDTEHFALTRNFLNRHEDVLRQLLDARD